MLILIPGFASVIKDGGRSVQVADDTMNIDGGMIVNPLSKRDQKIVEIEPLFIDLTGPASLVQIGTTVQLLPGQAFIVPPKTNVWINANTDGHAFTAVFSRDYTAQYPPVLQPGQPGSGIGIGGLGIPFPASAPTGLTKVIPSYLYQEYSDDDDLQGFCQAINELQQNYVDTFNQINLPIYPGPIVAGKLLDWVAQGLYGMSRPSIGVGRPVQIGPLNTWGPAMLPAINEIIQTHPGNVIVTNDDLFRRIITWHFFEGDGKYFNVRWIKRRVWRFIMGVNGTAPDYEVDPALGYQPHPEGEADADDYFIANTEQISVTLGADRNCTIRFVLGKRIVKGGAIPNMFGPNGFGPCMSLSHEPNYVDIQLNEIETAYVPYPPLPYMSTFKAALDSGVLETPYQFHFTCTIG